MITNKPLLIDFDGVIRIGLKPAEDSGKFLEFISTNRIPSFIISNSTLKTASDIKEFLKENEIDFNIPAMTTVDATLKYIKDHYNKISLYCDEKMKTHFKKFINDNKPEAIVIGDLGNKWNFEILNEIFRKVFEGTDLIAMQRNRFWKPDGINLSLDAGPFVAAIEYAAKKEAILIGKPSPIYFYSAIELLGFSKNSGFIMIGDDLETDIQAAQKLGGTGILVYTGKTKYPLGPDVEEKPCYEVQSLTEAISVLNKIDK